MFPQENNSVTMSVFARPQSRAQRSKAILFFQKNLDCSEMFRISQNMKLSENPKILRILRKKWFPEKSELALKVPQHSDHMYTHLFAPKILTNINNTWTYMHICTYVLPSKGSVSARIDQTYRHILLQPPYAPWKSHTCIYV